jgi:hypothetical protein
MVRPWGGDDRRRGPGAATAEGRSALDRVVQVQYAVAADRLVGIVEEDGAGVAAEEAYPFTQNTGATWNGRRHGSNV